VGNDTTIGARPSATVPEFSLGLAGTVIKSRYRVNAVSSVSRDVVVYSAEDVLHGRSIALKVLRDELARDAPFVAAVRERARALAQSAHVLRGVQRVYECGAIETGQLFIALEWVEGATLREVLDAGGALDTPTALRVAIRVGEALEALHHNRLVHGQLGPDSVIMVTDGERIRLCGAELAAAYRTPSGALLREAFALSYRAPEQIARGDATEATDVYALGMLLRQLLTAGKASQSPGAVVATPPLSPTLQRIIATALAPRPEHRYPDISMMVNDIWGVTAVTSEPPSRPRSTKGRGNPRRRVRRRGGPRALRMTAAAAAAGIVAAIVWVAGLDQIATQIYSRLTPPAVTAVPVERGILPPAETVPPPSAAREPTPMPSEPLAIEDRPAVERRAPVAAPPSPAGLSTIDGRPRASVEPRPPAAPRAPAASRAPVELRPTIEPPAVSESSAPIEGRIPTERPPRPERSEPGSGDGSAAVDWLLKDRR
jgi:serine/threonine-protein kinase